MSIPHNLYIHVPYCASKCNYCAFYSVCMDVDWDAYVAAVMRDIKYWGEILGHCTVPTIFFGGGTPSLMPTEIFVQIMDVVRANFSVATDAEITLESNPGTLDAERLAEFIAAGINRLSIGVQSLDDNVLEFLERRHTAQQARELIDAANMAGIRVSGDFIYALPGQTVADVEKMCRDILDLGVGHVSLYELSIEPGTPFAMQNLQVPDNETVAKMYQVIGEVLSPTLPRYEVSNYAMPGQECRHNANIWAGQSYIGIGPSAAGRPLIDGVWYEQSEPKDINAWLGQTGVGAHICAHESSVLGHKYAPLQNHIRATEIVMTGMRTIRGVVLTPEIDAVINWYFVKNNPDYFVHENNTIRAKPRGMLILDNLMVDLIK